MALSTNRGAALDALGGGTESSQTLISAGDRPFAIYPGHSLVMPDRETAKQFFEFYFDQCVVTYRCLHKQTCLSMLEAVLDNVASDMPLPHNLGSSKAAIVLAILAIVRLRKDKISDVNLAMPDFSSAQPPLSSSDEYFCEAVKLTSGEVGLPKLQSVQARILQVLYLLQTGRMNRAWYLFGMTSSMVAAIGLHRKSSRSRSGPDLGANVDYIAAQCARRTFWVVYIIDKYLSVALGRPRIWKDDDITQEYPDCVNDEDMGCDGPSMSAPSIDCHVDSLIAHSKYTIKLFEHVERHIKLTPS